MTTDRTYNERHRAAIHVLEEMQLNQVDGERMARAWHRRYGALGSLSIDIVQGDIWARPGLSRRDRSLMVIALLAALQNVEELGAHTILGLNNGLQRAEIDEVLLHVAVACGFPIALDAARVIDAALCKYDNVERQPMRQPAASKGDAERRSDAERILSSVFGRNPYAARRGPAFGEVGRVAYLYDMGEIWSRDQLSPRDRSLVMIALLSLLQTNDDLRWHMAAGLAHGLTPDEVTEVLVHLTAYIGIPRAIRAYEILQQVLEAVG